MNNVANLRLQAAITECSKHFHYLFEAMESLHPSYPFQGNLFEQLNSLEVRSIDQFILRFSKVQDAMGLRLFPAVLAVIQEDFEEKPMIDKLNRLEKLGYLHDARQWQTLRNVRNQLTHEYPDDPQKNAANLNLAFRSAIPLYQMYEKLIDVLSTTLPNYSSVRFQIPTWL